MCQWVGRNEGRVKSIKLSIEVKDCLLLHCKIPYHTTLFSWKQLLLKLLNTLPKARHEFLDVQPLKGEVTSTSWRPGTEMYIEFHLIPTVALHSEH